MAYGWGPVSGGGGVRGRILAASHGPDLLNNVHRRVTRIPQFYGQIALSKQNVHYIS